MIEPSFRFCPRCGKSLNVALLHGRQRQVCSACGFVLYHNQRVTTAAVIVRDNTMLFSKRRDNPYAGMLDLPGGFVEPDEHPEMGLLRELREELGVEGKVGRLLGAFGPDPYEFDGVIGYNISLHYQVDIADQTPVAADDVASLSWWSLTALPQTEEIAFPSHRQCVAAINTRTLHL